MSQIYNSTLLSESQLDINDEEGHSRSILAVYSLAFFSLIFAHLCIKEFFSNPIFWFAGASAITVANIFFMIKYRDTLGFILTMFICTHFAFADNQGGLWSYIICAVLLLAMLLKHQRTFSFSCIPRSINWLMFIFIAHQLVGLIFNPYSLISNIQSFIVICAQCLILYACASINMSKNALNRLFTIWFITAILIFLVALNQHYQWVITDSPLLPQREGAMLLFKGIPAGSFGNSELFAEYFGMVFLTAFIFLMYSKELASLHVNTLLSIIILFLSIASLIMSSARSAIILTGAAVLYLILNNLILTISLKSIWKTVVIVSIALLVFIFIANFGTYFSLEKTIQDFGKINPSISLKTVLSGEDINRGFIYDIAYQRLSENDWWIGYGFNLPENNRESLGLSGVPFADFHNLYLSLPIFYGWGGAVAYILIVLFTGIRAFSCYIRMRYFDHYLVPISLAFSLIWGLFLSDQFVISVTRNPSFFLLTWFLLGWTHAVVNSINRSK